jgi:hypothetical protein
VQLPNEDKTTDRAIIADYLTMSTVFFDGNRHPPEARAYAKSHVVRSAISPNFNECGDDCEWV